MRDFTFTISDKEGPVVFLSDTFCCTYRDIDSIDRPRIQKGIDNLYKRTGISPPLENKGLQKELDAKDRIISELREIVNNLPYDMAEIEKRWANNE